MQRIARSVPLKYRLEGLTTEQRAELALPPRLLRLLPDEYVASLPPDVQATVRARRGR